MTRDPRTSNWSGDDRSHGNWTGRTPRHSRGTLAPADFEDESPARFAWRILRDVVCAVAGGFARVVGGIWLLTALGF